MKSRFKGWRKNNFTFCCRPPGPLPGRERRVIPAAAWLFVLCALRAAGEIREGIMCAALAPMFALAATANAGPRTARQPHLSRWLLPFSFSITGAGAVYLAAVFLLSLAALNSGNNLLFLILATLLSAIIISGVAARTSLRGVFISLQVPENVFEGEEISIKVSVKNTKRLIPSFSITVEDIDAATSPVSRLRSWVSRGERLGGRIHDVNRSVLHHAAYFPTVLAGETRTDLVFQSFPRRGPYRLEGFNLSTRFPFGFFRRGERVRAEGEVLVYPTIHEVSSYFHLLPFLPGILEGLHVGQGESLHSIRKYQEGESARIVDWKATAKTAELMAREYARDEESKFCLILDTQVCLPVSPGYADQFEKAVSLAASLAAHFAREETELELLTPDEYVPRGIGTGHLYQILRSLALVSCRVSPAGTGTDLRTELAGVVEQHTLQEILSDKVFKIIVTSKPKGSFPSPVWHSSHVIYFDDL